MKKVLIALFLGLLCVPNAQAVPSCGTSLMPAFTANQATQLCKTFGSAVSQSLIPSADNTYDVGSSSLGWRTGYFDTSVITPLVNHATSLALGIAGTAEATLTNDTLTFSGAAASIVGGATSLTVGSAGSTIIKADADANRLFTFDASSDAALTQTFGDGGTTAAQLFTISASTADADDDSVLNLTGGGAVNSNRGAYISLYGNESTSSGNVNIGAGAGGDVQVLAQDDTLFYTGGSTLLWSMGDTGTLIGAGTATIGWTVKASGAGVACETACTTPCVFGQNATFGIELCSTAVTGLCVCAGAS